MPTSRYNIVMGSLPQLPVPLIDEYGYVDWRLIPNNVADGTINVVNGNVGIGLPPNQLPAHALDINGNVAVSGLIHGRLGAEEVRCVLLGCKGDGATDNTAAFQSCLDSDATAIVVPPGEYNVQGTLFIRKPTRILGYPGSIMIKTSAKQDPMIVVGDTVNVQGGVEILNMTFRSTRAANMESTQYSNFVSHVHPTYKQACLALIQCSGVVVSNCRFESFAKCIVARSAASDVSVERCVMDAYSQGIGTYGADDVRVQSCTFSSQQSLGGDVDGHAWYNAFQGSDLRATDINIVGHTSAFPGAIRWKNVARGTILNVAVWGTVAGVVDITDAMGVFVDTVVGAVGNSETPCLRVAATNVQASDIGGVCITNVDVSLNAPALHIEHHDRVTCEQCTFTYTTSENLPCIFTKHEASFHEHVLRDITVVFLTTLGNVPVAHLGRATLDGLKVVATQISGQAATYTVCSGAFDSTGRVSLEAGGAGAVEVLVWNNYGGPGGAGTGLVRLVPSVQYGLLSASGTPTYSALSVEQHEDSGHTNASIQSQAAVSLFTTTNRAPFINGAVQSDPEDPVEYSHRINVPTIPGLGKIGMRIYIASVYDVDHIVPLLHVPWLIPGVVGGGSLITAYVSGSGNGNATLAIESGLRDLVFASTVTQIPTNTWHDVEVVHSVDGAYQVSILIDGVVVGTASSTNPAPALWAKGPFGSPMYVGSSEWKQGIYMASVFQETSGTIVREPTLVSGYLSGNGSAIGDISASNITHGTLNLDRFPTNVGIRGNLAVLGNLVVSGGVTVLGGNIVEIQTEVQITDQIIVTNIGTGPALIVDQHGDEDVAVFKDDGNVFARFHDGGAFSVGGDVQQAAAQLHVHGNAYVSNAITIGNPIECHVQ
jgi:hypothetical protein